MDTSFSSYSTALSQNIKIEVEDDRYRYCFYLADVTRGKYGDQNLTFNQWLEIKKREREQPGSGYNLENIPVRDARASGSSSNSTLPSGRMLHELDWDEEFAVP
ncbi:unnamed protein product [Cylicostephanus goldi]|uniref:Uncharacterized protein n=1 Tax=Cylicostephanus goldi TaxID=71465 RepID=A0A3P6R8R3_CYLGO|nr:unnamed protein product [Cylicostephanus goldi]